MSVCYKCRGYVDSSNGHEEVAHRVGDGKEVRWWICDFCEYNSSPTKESGEDSTDNIIKASKQSTNDETAKERKQYEV